MRSPQRSAARFQRATDARLRFTRAAALDDDLQHADAGLARGFLQGSGDARSLARLQVAVAEQPSGMLELAGRWREQKWAFLRVLLESKKDGRLLEDTPPAIVDHHDYERAQGGARSGQTAQIMHETDVA